MLISSYELNGHTIRADVCVIGAGAAGITVAREFIGTGYSVVLLEAGGRRFDAADQEPYRSEIVGLAHKGVHDGRARVAGGTTSLWAGQCLPLFDCDFAARGWVPLSGWPIRRADLAAYYARAERVMEVPHAAYDATAWPRAAVPDLPASAGLRLAFSQFTRTPNFWDKYGDALRAAENVRIVTHAHVVELAATPTADAVRAVRCRGAGGSVFDVVATSVVVCCGGIESARLLLVSDSVDPAGVGNRHDVVGRYFQDHPGIAFPIQVLRREQFAAWYNGFSRGGIKYAVKLVAGDDLQQQEGMLNVAAEVFYTAADNDPITAAKVILRSVRRPELRRQVPRALKQSLARPHRVLRAAWRHYVARQPASVGSGPPMLGCGVEQLPNPDSRVTLSDQRDGFGVRRTRLDWRLTELETRTMVTFARRVRAMWATQGLATVDVDVVPMAGRDLGLHGGYVDANHHIGTTRMGTDPKTSVVDANCRVHGYTNLYIASSSVFPTGGCSNPTLTVLALTIRLCDRLKAAFAGSGVHSPASA